MRRLQMGLEGGGRIVDLVQHHLIGIAGFGGQHIEPAATRFIRDRGGGVAADMAQEFRHPARSDREPREHDETVRETVQELVHLATPELDVLIGMP